MTNLIDSIFSPVLTFFDNIQNRLDSIGTLTAKGLDLDNYFGFLTMLGNSWSGVISSLLSAVTFLAVLYIVKTNSRLYLWFKNVIKWW